jgi:hypothetical protein
MFVAVLHALLCLSPAIALAIPLLARRYPGERVLLERRRAQPLNWSRPRSSARPRRSIVLQLARGGRLIGCSLAERPPPAPVLAG